MISKILKALSMIAVVRKDSVIRSLKEQLHASRALVTERGQEIDRRVNEYADLADRFQDLKDAYQRLQFARLEDYRLQRIPKREDRQPEPGAKRTLGRLLNPTA